VKALPERVKQDEYTGNGNQKNSIEIRVFIGGNKF
jgi:hypothetical protein